jgi:hypothetical protein
MKRRYLIVTLWLFAFHCVRDSQFDQYLNITNNSGQTISFLVPDVSARHKYPDIALEDTRGITITIPPGQTGSWHVEETIKSYYDKLKTDTLSYFIFSADTLAKYDWETIRHDYKVLRRYDLAHNYFVKHSNYSLILKACV